MAKQNFLIIGGSKGIGLALTKKILDAGHEAIVMCRSDLLDEIKAAKHIQTDVLEDDLPGIEEPLNGLAYCPGTILLKPFKSLKEENFRQDFETNVLGAVNAIQKYMGNLKQSDHASVLLFSTIAVQTGMPFHASVAASKGAVEGMTRSLAAELAPRIRVNAIAPSITDTELAKNVLRTEKSREASAERHPLKRIGEPEDIAEAAWYLLSGRSSWVTGQILPVDGGLSSVRNL